jgi:hypothetical protein
MQKIFGWIIIVISCLGIYFFRYYSGTLIGHPNLWFVFFAAFSLFGFWMIAVSSKASEKKSSLKSQQDRSQFKERSDKIILDINRCKFMSGSSYEQIENEDLSLVLMLAPPRLSNLVETSSIREVDQSCLIYEIGTGKKVVRYTSEAFPFSEITLKSYVMEHKVCLYIDRFDRKKYMFDLTL